MASIIRVALFNTVHYLEQSVYYAGTGLKPTTDI